MEDAEQRRILLIDCDHDLLTRLKVLLGDEGYDATTAWGGREALRPLGSKRFDVILLSDHLPDTNGRELWRLLQKVPSDAELALIQGSDPVTEDVRALFRDYADHCILPRSTPGRIASAVAHCLRRQAASVSSSTVRISTEKMDYGL
ncbi:MAG: response regulator [Terriglobia bacterium]